MNLFSLNPSAAPICFITIKWRMKTTVGGGYNLWRALCWYFILFSSTGDCNHSTHTRINPQMKPRRSSLCPKIAAYFYFHLNKERWSHRNPAPTICSVYTSYQLIHQQHIVVVALTEQTAAICPISLDSTWTAGSWFGVEPQLQQLRSNCMMRHLILWHRGGSQSFDDLVPNWGATIWLRAAEVRTCGVCYFRQAIPHKLSITELLTATSNLVSYPEARLGHWKYKNHDWISGILLCYCRK